VPHGRPKYRVISNTFRDKRNDAYHLTSERIQFNLVEDKLRKLRKYTKSHHKSRFSIVNYFQKSNYKNY